MSVVVVPKGGRQLVVRIGIAAGRARPYCVRREAVLGRGYVSAVQVNGDIAGCAAEGGYRKTVGVAHDDLTSHARPDGRAGSETVEAHDAGQLAGDDLDIRLAKGKVIGIGRARHRGRSQYGRDVESLGERGTACAEKERRNRPVLSPRHHTGTLHGVVRRGSRAPGEVRIHQAEVDGLAVCIAGDPENVRRSHVDREHPRGIPRYAVIQQIEHVTLPRRQRHAERRQATRARGAPRFEIRVIVDGYENRSRDLPLNHGGTGAALPTGTDLPTGTSTACAPTAACRKCDGECQGEQQVKHLPIGFRRCSHAFFPLYYFVFVSELRSKARVVYRKMILAAERTPPFSVPWTCNLTSG